MTVLAYDSVQGLLAAGTDSGRIYVFGQPGVEVTFDLSPGTPIYHLRIVRSLYVVSVDKNNAVTVISLDTQQILSVFQPPYPITAIESDPSLDWLFIGMDNGQTIVYDIDRCCKTPLKIGNLQKLALPMSRMSPVVFIALHPRSLSVILFGYVECALIYSVAENRILHTLRYELPPGAPGGDLHSSRLSIPRYPLLTTGAWHPNGHHILTAYEDGSLVFWDAKEGVLIQARTLENTDVNHPASAHVTAVMSADNPSARREPIYKIAWCCGINPEDTALVIAGGESSDVPLHGLTYMDFGTTPLYQVTSYQAMADHYSFPKRQRIYPVSSQSDPVDFVMISRSGPHYAGNQNPMALIAVMSSGELYSIEYPSGSTLGVASTFPPSLCWIHPKLTSLSMAAMRREHWIGMIESIKNSEDVMLTGGAPMKRRLRSFDLRSIIVTGHTNGCVRLWDASHGELENSRVLEVDISEALDRAHDIIVADVSFAGHTGEISVACETGEVVFYRFGINKPSHDDELASQTQRMSISSDKMVPAITMIKNRANKNLNEGFLPQFILTTQKGPVTCIKNSEIGFLAVGYQFGALCVVDLRNASMIYLSDLTNLGAESGSSGSQKKFSRVSGSRQTMDFHSPQIDIPVVIEFSILMLEGDGYSSILLSVGTSLGRLLTFKVIPVGPGKYAVEFVSAFSLKGKVVSLIPYDTEAGVPAVASAGVLPQLAQGIRINGALIAVTTEEIRIVKFPKTKLMSRSLEDKCLSAGLSYLRKGDTLALVVFTQSGFIRVYSIPSLREITHIPVQNMFDVRYAHRSLILLSGDILLGTNRNEAALINIFGKGKSFKQLPTSALYDALKGVPPRPVISTMQWISGTKHVTQDDFDVLSKFADHFLLCAGIHSQIIYF